MVLVTASKGAVHQVHGHTMGKIKHQVSYRDVIIHRHLSFENNDSYDIVVTFFQFKYSY